MSTPTHDTTSTTTPEGTAAQTTSSKVVVEGTDPKGKGGGKGGKKRGVATKTKLTKTERKDKYTRLARERSAQHAMRVRGRNLVCFGCRKHGHAVEQCPQTKTAAQGGSGGKRNRQRSNAATTAVAERCCYKCGATDHAIHTCPKRGNKDDGSLPFASCFICGGRGHLSRSCPQNTKGIYVNGGACKVCGSTQHLSTACTAERQTLRKEDKEESDDGADYSNLLEGEGDEQGRVEEESQTTTTTVTAPPPPPKRRQRVVQF
jgi:zinc finger CCHC domain-containing protein 9